jgi:hypothetical protein
MPVAAAVAFVRALMVGARVRPSTVPVDSSVEEVQAAIMAVRRPNARIFPGFIVYFLFWLRELSDGRLAKSDKRISVLMSEVK